MNKKSVFKYVFFLIIVCVFLICGFVYSCSDEKTGGNAFETVENGLMAEQSAVADEANSVSISTQEGMVETVTEYVSEICYVYVCGQVKSPGVYEVSNESRIYEAIELAGGITEDGCLMALNLAEQVYDGQKLYVPSFDEYELSDTSIWQIEETEQTGKGKSGLININTADKVLLMTLPGIGSTRAEAIIEYRQANGDFKGIEDIMQVSGIKEGAYNKIKDLICTE